MTSPPTLADLIADPGELELLVPGLPAPRHHAGGGPAAVMALVELHPPTLRTALFPLTDQPFSKARLVVV
jgi:hypothetical protein